MRVFLPLRDSKSKPASSSNSNINNSSSNNNNNNNNSDDDSQESTTVNASVESTRLAATKGEEREETQRTAFANTNNSPLSIDDAEIAVGASVVPAPVLAIRIPSPPRLVHQSGLLESPCSIRPTPTTTTTVAVAVVQQQQQHSRKRRSFSPFVSLLDSKLPASTSHNTSNSSNNNSSNKKHRGDSKPAAREASASASATPSTTSNSKVVTTTAQLSLSAIAATTSSSTSTSTRNISTRSTAHQNTQNSNNTMAGGNSRGARKHGNNNNNNEVNSSASSASSSSYYVENNASSNDHANRTAGPEDTSPATGRHNNHTDQRHQQQQSSLEVDARYAYRHENDPASAHGVDSVAATPSLMPVAISAVADNSKSSSSTSGDDDVRDATCHHKEETSTSTSTSSEQQQHFPLSLKKQGLEMVEQAGDGNCLFRAISLQVYGDASMHLEIRHRCLDFMSRDREHFSQFITDEPFEQYIGRKRQDGVHGNNPEIQAISELFNRPIEVFVPENGAAPLNIFHAEYKTQDAPIRLSYHDGNHYNAVIDPLVPTAGLGLGLPGLQPGLADKMQMAKAVAESDRLADQTEFDRAMKESQNDQLQRAIKESSLTVDHMCQHKAMSLSDCDATNFELEQAVLESSLEAFRTSEIGRKQEASSGSGKSASGRRKRQASPPHQEELSSSNSGVAAAVGAAVVQPSSSVASMPSEKLHAPNNNDSVRVPGAASAASAAAVAPSVASRPSNDASSSHAYGGPPAAPMMAEHYPQCVQELVMNGFELRKVVHAYELVGDNFDNLLGFLMSTS